MKLNILDFDGAEKPGDRLTCRCLQNASQFAVLPDAEGCMHSAKFAKHSKWIGDSINFPFAIFTVACRDGFNLDRFWKALTGTVNWVVISTARSNTTNHTQESSFCLPLEMKAFYKGLERVHVNFAVAISSFAFQNAVQSY